MSDELKPPTHARGRRAFSGGATPPGMHAVDSPNPAKGGTGAETGKWPDESVPLERPAEKRPPYDHERYSEVEKRYRRQILQAAVEALDAAQSDVNAIKRRSAISGSRKAEPGKLSEERRVIGERRLWEAFLQDPKLAENTAAWSAAADLTSQISQLEISGIPAEDSLNSLLRAIESMRAQIAFIERHQLPIFFAEIVSKAAKRLRWKVAAILAAVLAELGAGGDPITLRVLLGALAVSSARDAATAAIDEIRDQLAIKSKSHTPHARVYEVNVKLLDPIDVLVTLLLRRAGGEQLEDGESGILRMAGVTASFLIINAQQRSLDYDWSNRDEYVGALRRASGYLDDVLDMAISRDYRGAAATASKLKNVYKELKDNAP